jgi:hypothetical protein
MIKHVVVFCLAVAGYAVFPVNAYAAETVTYTYDALGRLIGSQVSSGPANGVTTAIQYDAADNRSNYTVTGASNSPPGQMVIVVPLNGFTIIPITNSWMLP